MMLDPLVLLALGGAGLLAGFVDAIAGGGGLIALPALLAAGVPPVAALGTNKVQSVIGTGIAAITYWRSGYVSLRALAARDRAALSPRRLSAPSSSSRSTRRLLQDRRADRTDRHRALFPVRAAPHATTTATRACRSALFVPVMGAAIGFYDGIFGPGTGSFLTIGFVTLFGLG